MPEQLHDLKTFFQKCKHIKPSALAKAANMSKSRMSHLVNGVRSPSAAVIKSLNKAIDNLEDGIASQLRKHRIK